MRNTYLFYACCIDDLKKLSGILGDDLVYVKMDDIDYFYQRGDSIMLVSDADRTHLHKLYLACRNVLGIGVDIEKTSRDIVAWKELYAISAQEEWNVRDDYLDMTDDDILRSKLEKLKRMLVHI